MRWLAVLPLIIGIAGCGGETEGAPADAHLVDDAMEPDTLVPGDAGSESALDAADAPVTLTPIADQTVAEDALLEVPIEAPAGRVFVSGLPPGARFDEAKRTIRFRPDFIQGGPSKWTVTVDAGGASTSFAVAVTDSIRPPELTVVKSEDLGACLRVTLRQTTDAYTDSKGYAGRTFSAIAVVPKAASETNRVPVRVVLHGVGGDPNPSLGCSANIVLEPHDTMTSYWWGYSERLPGPTPTSGTVPPYTVRRVLQLVEWAQRTRHGDPARTFIGGGSMGGAGALAIGLLWGRHFAAIDATLAQAIARNHRPSRVATLERLWGTRALNLDDGAGMGVWDRLDLTRALRDDPDAADPFVFLRHGKDDPTIHFGAVVIPSALTKLTFYGALATHPHYAVWDEGAHGPGDPVMPSGWWDSGFSRISDATSFTRLDRALPGFSRSSLNNDPGDGTGNGKVTWSPESGYAGTVAVAGDTGWKGEVAGAINRHLRWDATKIVDERDRFEVPLRVYSAAGGDPPRAGYPTIDDRVSGALPAKVDVTLRRVQAFRVLPGQKLGFVFGARTGEVTVGTDGAITIPELPLTTTWTTLIVRPSS